ncbi:MAG: hypothetical protein MZW92_24585 [Comamonadaceae bacterium]|nr:hypothetical protein [Comamonadaceae bacterium]
MEKAFGLASSGVQGLVGALSVGATAAFFRSIVDGVDSLNDFADAAGTSVENASALEDVARRSGAGVDVARDAVLKLTRQWPQRSPAAAPRRRYKRSG